MATYIMLASFTDQGIRKVKDSPKRADAFKNMAKKCGATVKDVFWTLGEYDVVATRRITIRADHAKVAAQRICA
jgi:uncharacterized protein with GYD domain